jgi:exodeoxyribonuclease-3
MKLISWNVNGLRAVLKKGFLDFLGAESPEVLLLQEVKATPDQVGHDFAADGWEVHWNPAQKKGYSGVATLSRVPVIGVRHGIGLPGQGCTSSHQPWYAPLKRTRCVRRV